MKKNELIQIRTTEEEKELLKSKAFNRNMSLSEYMLFAAKDYDPEKIRVKHIHINSIHVGGKLYATFTIEVSDAEIVAVTRFFKEDKEIKGICAIVGRTIDEIIQLTNPLYARSILINWLKNTSDNNILKEYLEEEE